MGFDATARLSSAILLISAGLVSTIGLIAVVIVEILPRLPGFDSAGADSAGAEVAPLAALSVRGALGAVPCVQKSNCPLGFEAEALG